MRDLSNLFWHFTAQDAQGPFYRDGRRLVVGEWVEHDSTIVMCKSGMHASRRAIDALQYAPGPVVSLCELEGIGDEGSDKIVGRRRRPLFAFDASAVLNKFARDEALTVLVHWSCPVPDVVRQWLATGDEQYRSAAESAAWSAAESAARRAAESAAKSATWSAAESAAWRAARSAAESAAESAARSAARSATWSAARSAARSAAKSAQNERLTKALLDASGWQP